MTESSPLPGRPLTVARPTVAQSDTMSMASTVREHSDFIWSVADLLRGDYKRSEYGRVILPLTVLRRLDSVLEPTKAADHALSG